MSVEIKVVRKSQGVESLPEEVRKSASRSLGKMPTILVGVREKDGEVVETAGVGFRYRRQSHHCELTYWGGEDEDLLADLAKACVAQMILEGRKRAEVVVEFPLEEGYNEKEYKVSPRGGELFCKALEKAGFYYEGFMENYTKFLEDVKFYSWVTLEQGLPEWDEDVKISLGQNETTESYRQKNIDLYKKDRDYYSYTSADKDKRFSEILEDQYQWVKNHPQIEVEEGWSKD